jgi:hypothetical protein
MMKNSNNIVIPKTNLDESKCTYEQETEIINKNKKTKGNKPHNFKSAQWTHKNGHPRCLWCGDEETISGKCDGYISESLDRLLSLIESRSATSSDFNTFIEGLDGEFDNLLGDEPLHDVEDQWDMEATIHKLTGRDPQIEQIILSAENPEWVCRYAFYVINRRWPEAEPFIMKDPYWAFCYARDVIKGRWPEAEPFIMVDPKLASFYARDIIKGRWPEAEPLIMKDPEWAYSYAYNAIKGRWPEAEPIIMRDPKWADKYREKFGMRESLNRLYGLIETKSITSSDFNIFIEGLPKSANERVLRRARLKPGKPLRPVAHSPVKKVEANLQKTGDNNPLRTARGRISVRKQGEKNKKNASKFAEATQFVLNNHAKTIQECEPLLSTVEDMASLNTLITRLLSSPDIFVSHDWLYGVKQLTEGRFGNFAKSAVLAGALASPMAGHTQEPAVGKPETSWRDTELGASIRHRRLSLDTYENVYNKINGKEKSNSFESLVIGQLDDIDVKKLISWQKKLKKNAELADKRSNAEHSKNCEFGVKATEIALVGRLDSKGLVAYYKDKHNDSFTRLLASRYIAGKRGAGNVTYKDGQFIAPAGW